MNDQRYIGRPTKPCARIECGAPILVEYFACTPCWLQLSVSARVDLLDTMNDGSKLIRHAYHTAQAILEWNALARVDVHQQ